MSLLLAILAILRVAPARIMRATADLVVCLPDARYEELIARITISQELAQGFGLCRLTNCD